MVTERQQSGYIPLVLSVSMSLEKSSDCLFCVCHTTGHNPLPTSPRHWRSIVKEQKPQTLMCLRKGVRRWRALPMWGRSTWKSLVIARLSWIKRTIEQKNEKAVPRGRENMEEGRRVSLVKPFQSRSWRTSRKAQLLYICWEHWNWTGTNISILSLFRWGFCLLWYGYNTFCN